MLIYAYYALAIENLNMLTKALAEAPCAAQFFGISGPDYAGLGDLFVYRVNVTP